MAKKKEGYTDRLIRLPDSVWAALDGDADRCRRSSTGQLEALLLAYFEINDIELGELPPREGFGRLRSDEGRGTVAVEERAPLEVMGKY